MFVTLFLVYIVMISFFVSVVHLIKITNVEQFYHICDKPKEDYELVANNLVVNYGVNKCQFQGTLNGHMNSLVLQKSIFSDITKAHLSNLFITSEEAVLLASSLQHSVINVVTFKNIKIDYIESSNFSSCAFIHQNTFGSLLNHSIIENSSISVLNAILFTQIEVSKFIDVQMFLNYSQLGGLLKSSTLQAVSISANRMNAVADKIEHCTLTNLKVLNTFAVRDGNQSDIGALAATIVSTNISFLEAEVSLDMLINDFVNLAIGALAGRLMQLHDEENSVKIYHPIADSIIKVNITGIFTNGNCTQLGAFAGDSMEVFTNLLTMYIFVEVDFINITYSYCGGFSAFLLSSYLIDLLMLGELNVTIDNLVLNQNFVIGGFAADAAYSNITNVNINLQQSLIIKQYIGLIVYGGFVGNHSSGYQGVLKDSTILGSIFIDSTSILSDKCSVIAEQNFYFGNLFGQDYGSKIEKFQILNDVNISNYDNINASNIGLVTAQQIFNSTYTQVFVQIQNCNLATIANIVVLSNFIGSSIDSLLILQSSISIDNYYVKFQANEIIAAQFIGFTENYSEYYSINITETVLKTRNYSSYFDFKFPLLVNQLGVKLTIDTLLISGQFLDYSLILNQYVSDDDVTITRVYSNCSLDYSYCIGDLLFSNYLIDQQFISTSYQYDEKLNDKIPFTHNQFISNIDENNSYSFFDNYFNDTFHSFIVQSEHCFGKCHGNYISPEHVVCQLDYPNDLFPFCYDISTVQCDDYEYLDFDGCLCQLGFYNISDTCVDQGTCQQINCKNQGICTIIEFDSSCYCQDHVFQQQCAELSYMNKQQFAIVISFMILGSICIIIGVALLVYMLAQRKYTNLQLETAD